MLSEALQGEKKKQKGDGNSDTRFTDAWLQCTHTYTRTHTHIYIYTHVHTHTDIYTYKMLINWNKCYKYISKVLYCPFLIASCRHFLSDEREVNLHLVRLTDMLQKKCKR